MTTIETSSKIQRSLRFRILGRMLEHLGVQMYKHRAPAIAELVANSWDAGAKSVEISIPEPMNYDRFNSAIIIEDDGRGMEFNEIQDRYLVIGKNRRREDGVFYKNRRLMGRKGIGKLAGFGLAKDMIVHTWTQSCGYEFKLNLSGLKADDGETADIEIPWKPLAPPAGAPASGTRVTLSQLKHESPIDISGLMISIARRFSRTVQGDMSISVNGKELPDPTPKLDKRIPEQGFETADLGNGNQVKHWYGFSSETIKSKELQGFTVQVSGKTAQAPPFFFNVESTASGQHATRYVIGVIQADYLDDSTDDESDLISTDRQEIDWESGDTKPLREWGEAFTRRILRECVEYRGDDFKNWILDDKEFQNRLKRLEKESRKQISKFLKTLGRVADQSEESRDLASSLIRAYEFHQFHNVIDDIEAVGDDPDALRELLTRLEQWRVLESRAILEVVKGRLEIIDKFETMLVTDTPETAPIIGADNMHDLIGGRPWLLHPEWQVLNEEKTITAQLREWGIQDIEDVDRDRYDFLAIGNDRDLVVIEIKRPNYPATLDDLHRLESYRERLSLAHKGRTLRIVFICGSDPNISDSDYKVWENAEDREITFWANLFEQSKAIYSHYRSLLESDISSPDFGALAEEVMETRRVLESGSVYRGQQRRQEGIPGPSLYPPDKTMGSE